MGSFRDMAVDGPRLLAQFGSRHGGRRSFLERMKGREELLSGLAAFSGVSEAIVTLRFADSSSGAS